MEVAFFGGSFDPPHFGHVLAASYALGRGFQRVLVVPVRAHAFGKRLAAYDHRLEMARAAFAHLPDVVVSDVERALPEPNYTLNTLQALSAAHPDFRFRLVIGSDVLSEAPRWNRFDEVSALAPPFVLNRDGSSGALRFPDVSSTEVRRQLRSHEDRTPFGEWLEERVPIAVLTYASVHGLYGVRDVASD